MKMLNLTAIMVVLIKSIFTGSNNIVSGFEKKDEFVPAIFEGTSVLK